MINVRKFVEEARRNASFFNDHKGELKHMLTPFEYRTLCEIHGIHISEKEAICQ